ncbi:hypothetical protein KGF54_001468 [Candida jiufengensis]|uniref:uncharacterized protein n=1 Tax=Candida jiufengensis TaxID=497108 RepID=UPI0022240F88|nr:uncharacterized protein KGF54_001468 [Candida jiufengensis]KAI5954907.1 hypothetical protein KGF54_001468 [Candida jiufengensis]
MSNNIEEFIKQVPSFKESRLNSLYSDFEKNKQLNPEGYQANIQAWKSLISKLITSIKYDSESQLSLSVYNPNLKHALMIPIYGEPKNLNGILQELVNERFLVPESLFMGATETYIGVVNNHFTLRDYTSINAWLHWRSLKNFQVSKNDKLVNDKYIYWDELVKLGEKFKNNIKSKIVDNERYSNTLFTNDQLYNKINKELNITKQDFKIFLKYISRDLKLCKVKEVDGVTYIKFPKSERDEITNEDISIINIKSNLQSLDIRVKELEKKLQNIDLKSVLKFPKDIQKLKLSQLIKFKKNLTIKLDQNISLQNEMFNILNKINDARFNIDYLQILSDSAKVLSKFNNAINIEDIDKVRVDIDDKIAKEQHISDALTENKEIEHDDELDKELEKLLEEDKLDKEAAAQEDSTKLDEENQLLHKLEKLKVLDQKSESIPNGEKAEKIIAE